jgi:hypothetical protein
LRGEILDRRWTAESLPDITPFASENPRQRAVGRKDMEIALRQPLCPSSGAERRPPRPSTAQTPEAGETQHLRADWLTTSSAREPKSRLVLEQRHGGFANRTFQSTGVHPNPWKSTVVKAHWRTTGERITP